MPDLFVFLAGVFFALTAVLLAALARHIHRLGQRLAALERRANPGSRHDWKALERHDIGESALFRVAHLRQAIELAQAHEQQLTDLLARVAAGGHPDDPPQKWLKPRKE